MNFKSDLFKNSFLSVFSTIIRLIINFIINKLVAIHTGTTGIAILGQITNLNSILLTISTGGVNSGVVKYISEFNTDRSKINFQKLLNTVLTLSTILSIILILIMLIFSKYFSTLIFSENNSLFFIYLSAFGLFFNAINSLYSSILNGKNEFTKFIQFNIISNLIMLLLVFSLIYIYEDVIFIYILIAPFFSFLLYIERIRKLIFLENNFKFEINWYFLKKLSGYSIATIFTAFSLPISQLIIRTKFLNYNDDNSAGLWEGLNRLSSVGISTSSAIIAMYFLPKLSAAKNYSECFRLIKKGYIIIIPFAVMGLFFIYIFKKYIIVTLYDESFLEISKYLHFQLIGDFVKTLSLFFSYFFLARNKILMFCLFEVSFFAFYTASSVFSIPSFGIYGVTISYFFSLLVVFSLQIIGFNKLLKSEKYTL